MQQSGRYPNYAGDRNGACARNGHTYGYSVLVWKDDVKRRATFCPADSFLPQVTADTFCTYDTMEVMLAWIDKDVFEDLYNRVILNQTVAPRSGRFIECHVYDPMTFRGMLDHVRVSRIDPAKSSKPAEIERNVREFCRRNGTRWEWATL